ncbi:hypothetical protein HELRODRAFT_146034, partial [Helobdella robusta]
LFTIYINDLPSACENIYLFADDAKMFKIIKCPDDLKSMQLNVINMQNWLNVWRMIPNVDKCCVLKFGNKYNNIYEMWDSAHFKQVIQVVKVIKDLGVFVDDKLTFRDHIYSKVKLANTMLGIINRHVRLIDEEAYLCFYKGLVIPHLEYAVQVWCP